MVEIIAKIKTEIKVKDKNNQDIVGYPFIDAEDVNLPNGMTLDSIIEKDITIPTVTHEENNFKVGAGIDQDVSSSIIDSSVAEMTIKGQTYQNILPEPSTYTLKQNKSMFKVNEGLVPNVKIVDGVAKEAVLKGQTLVNYFSKEIYGSENWYKLHDGDLYRVYNNFPSLIKGKIYTIYAPIGDKTNNAPNALINLHTITDGVEHNIYYTFSNSHDTILKTFTMGDELRFHNFNIIGTRFEQNYPKIMIIDGEWTEETLPHYFENMISSKTLSLKCSNNIMLLNPNKSYSNNNKSGCIIEEISPTEYIFTNKKRQQSAGFGFLLKRGTEFSVSFKYEKLSGCSNGCQFESAHHGGIAIKEYLNDEKGEISVSYTVMRDTKSFIHFKPCGELESEESILKITDLKWTADNNITNNKINTLNILEEINLHSVPNGICDSLNLNTGEFIQKIGVYQVTGDEDFIYPYSSGSCVKLSFNTSKSVGTNGGLLCDKLPINNNLWSDSDSEGIRYHDTSIHISINKTKLETPDIEGVKKYIKVIGGLRLIYKEPNPIIRKIELSSSGNYEKIILNGDLSEDWKQDTHKNNFIKFDGYSNFCLYSLMLPLVNEGLFCDKFNYYAYDGGFRWKDIEGISDGGGYKLIFLRLKTEKLPSDDIEGLRQYLSQNPISVCYQTQDILENTQVKQPIFFKDGFINLLTNDNNSLLPILEYRAKTTNSYVMDLMKVNTKYTMKVNSVKNTASFSIDNSTYPIKQNSVFNSPNNLTNKFLVLHNLDNEGIMIFEGDLTDKNIPYIEKIKSVFEDKKQIEILSTGKNLFNINGNINEKYDIMIANGINERIECNGFIANNYSFSHHGVGPILKVKPNIIYNISGHVEGSGLIALHSKLNTNIGLKYPANQEFSFTYSNQDLDEICLSFLTAGTDTTPKAKYFDIQFEENSIGTTSELYKSNTTKIPLLSSLKSLPYDNIYDEIILDRENNKAKIIQRVGEFIFDDKLEYGLWNSTYAPKDYIPLSYPYTKIYGLYQHLESNTSKKNFISNLPIANTQQRSEQKEYISSFYTNVNDITEWYVIINIKASTKEDAINKLSKYSVKLLYPLENPIITEVDMFGYPYVYKDGHIVLNSDIKPISTIKYSISKKHQIEANVLDLTRHEKDINYLYKLISEYIKVDYESTLLSLDLELK